MGSGDAGPDEDENGIETSSELRRGPKKGRLEKGEKGPERPPETGDELAQEDDEGMETGGELRKPN